MNILLLGSGGREHALAWKVKQSPACNKLYIAPGNAGTGKIGINVDLSLHDFVEQEKFCIEHNIEMIIVGPEEPLVNGIYDYFNKRQWETSITENNIMVVGPSAHGARLEGSKAFAKKFMEKYGIPTAAYEEFNAENFEDGKKYLANHSLPVVIKADGLAAGKGVVISETNEHAITAFSEMILNKQFGDASAHVVVEQFLSGIEVSVFIITDGKDYKVIGHAKDYKRIGEGDKGLNTGGMGCVSPVPFADNEFLAKVEKTIIEPTIRGLSEENIAYKGFIFFGLINVQGEPYLIEYNCRMGDPETEVVIPLLQNDLLDLFLSLFNETLQNQKIVIAHTSCATVVAVSEGYPGDYKKGIPIENLDTSDSADTLIFHAGTKLLDNAVVTNGGRVLAVTCFGNNIKTAVEKCQHKLSQIHFQGMYYRKDIGYEFTA